MKTFLTTALLSSLCFSAIAQQDPLFSQNMFTKLNANPAYAGISKTISASVLGNDQWSDAPTPPSPYMFNCDTYLPCINSGLGLTYWHSNMGFEKNNAIKLSYSYHIPLGNGTLGIGTSLGYYKNSLSDLWGTIGNQQQNPSITIYDMSLGLYYATEQGFYMGISSNQLPQISSTANFNGFVNDQPRHYTFMTGCTSTISSTWDMLEDVYLQSGSDYTQFQLNMRAQYNKSFWFGMGYRMNEAYIGMVGFTIYAKNGSYMSIGYSHDFNIEGQTGYAALQELFLQFTLKQKANKV